MEKYQRNKSLSSIKKDIMKEAFTLGRLKYRFIPSLPLAVPISQWIAAFSIKKGLKPNTITWLMIPTALVSSIFLAFPNILCVIISLFTLNIWFALDIADGVVARYTKCFSMYGEVNDFLSHHVCSFFMISGCMIGLYFRREYSVSTILFVYAMMLYTEYAFRNRCTIDLCCKKTETIYNIQSTQKLVSDNKFWLFIRILLHTIDCIENYVLLFPTALMADGIFKSHLALILSVAYIAVAFIENYVEITKQIKKCFKA